MLSAVRVSAPAERAGRLRTAAAASVSASRAARVAVASRGEGLAELQPGERVVVDLGEVRQGGGQGSCSSALSRAAGSCRSSAYNTDMKWLLHALMSPPAPLAEALRQPGTTGRQPSWAAQMQMPGPPRARFSRSSLNARYGEAGHRPDSSQDLIPNRPCYTRQGGDGAWAGSGECRRRRRLSMATCDLPSRLATVRPGWISRPRHGPAGCRGSGWLDSAVGLRTSSISG